MRADKYTWEAGDVTVTRPPPALRAKRSTGREGQTGAASELGQSGIVAFVQFPHPGAEHSMPTDGVRPWRGGNATHARSFLVTPGRFRVAPEGPEDAGDVAYWAEWEGETRLVRELEGLLPGAPRWLCRPVVNGAPPRLTEGEPPQNTDPYVFGEGFRYTFCRQKLNGKLRGLGRGSLILFGSTLDHHFVLDTVVVVAGWLEHRRLADLGDSMDETYVKATLEPMYGWGEGKRTYRLYVGATPEATVDGMFSFVPGRPPDEAGFARPVIELEALIKPTTFRQARVLETPAAELRAIWQRVVEQVRESGLALATRLDLPGEE